MILKHIKKTILLYQRQFFDVGNKKVILFISDDWGGVRLDPRMGNNPLKGLLNFNQNRFDNFDTLESNKDIEGLFEVLLKHKNAQKINPIITAVTNVANPDFVAMRGDRFTQYIFESFCKTLENYPKHNQVYKYFLEGIQNKIFIPESHGREHVHIGWWMENLKHPGSFAEKAFPFNYFFLPQDKLIYPKGRNIDAAFDIWDPSEIKMHKETAISGLKLFKNIFGYDASYFTPPSLKYNSELEPTLFSLGIKWIDVPVLQKMPIGFGKYKPKFHYLGQKSSSGLRYLVRNAVFEPNMHPDSDGVDSCLAQIATAFKYKVPAIISNHRAAFVGGIDPANRDKGLKALDTLLKKILQTWPDVEFITVRDLDNLLNKPSK